MRLSTDYKQLNFSSGGRSTVSGGGYLRIHDSEPQLLHRQKFDRFMCWDADLPRDLVERIWCDPSALRNDGKKLQDKLRCSVVRIEHESGPFVWKQHNWGSLARTLKRSLSQSVASKCWTDGHFLHKAGLPTPRPRAYVERRFGSFGASSYLLTDYIAGTSLYRFMRFERPSRDVVRQLARQVASIWQQLDDLCVWHNDFKTENLVVDPQGKVWLIDLERMRRFRSVDEARRRRVRDASDLLHPRNWRMDPGAAEVFRQEILKTTSASETLIGPQCTAHPLSQPVSQTNNTSQLVTVVIPCRDAASTISACVESVRDMADEILVADAGSSDETISLVRRLGGCRIIQKDCSDQAEFAAWADKHARYPWILRILPDERLNAELGRQVQDLLACDPAEDGFRISRADCFRGHRLKYGGFSKDSSLRLYRKSAARYVLHNGRLEVNIGSGKCGYIRERLVHDACLNIDHYLREMIRLSAEDAINAQRQGLRPQRVKALWRAPWQMFQSYFLRGGWLDGWAGLHACSLQAFAIYLRETMLWELQQPIAARRNLVGESWRELKLFDPSGMIAPSNSTSDGSFVLPAVQPVPDAGFDRRQMRPAA